MSKPWVPYVVQQGDHLDKVAFLAGAEASAIWSHEKNRDLAAKRKNRNTLYPGDVLFVPAEPAPALDLEAGTSNRFTAKVPKVPIHVKLQSKRRALGNKKFEVWGAGGKKPIEGTTSAEGDVTFEVPVGVREVELRVEELGLALHLSIGDLDPIEETSGVTQRLRNLAYLPASGAVSPEMLSEALAAFQRKNHLAVNGELDAETYRALEEKHLG